MENQSSSNENDIVDYTEENDLPFGADPDKPSSWIMHNVLWAKGRIPGSPWEGKLAVMKLVEISPRPGASLQDAKHACRKEAKIMFAARHVHIMNIITAYFDSSQPQRLPRFVIIMDRANDGDLSAYLNRVPTEGDPNTLQCRWIGCLIRAVAHVHRLGIRHRDIKPQNVLIDGDEVFLTDFGISLISLGVTVPTTNKMWNKPRTTDYCAPEVDEGEGRTRGRSADIFSLGAVILEMLLSHSYNPEYQELRRKIMIRHDKWSYARFIPKVHLLLEELIERLTQESATSATMRWHLPLLRLCQRMLNRKRELRPSGDEVEDIWDRDIVRMAKSSGVTQLDCQRCKNLLPKNTNETQLIAACRAGKSEDVNALLNRGADPNVQGAIHQAVLNGHSQIVYRILRSRGADVNTQDYAGKSALHYAALKGDERTVRALLTTENANVNAVDDERQSPLHCAAINGSLPVIEQLIAAGANINATDNDRLSPLYYAVRQNNPEAVKFLLKQGADKEIRDNHRKEDSIDGYTAEEYARARDFKVVANILRNWNPEKKSIIT